jgi:4-amino-4-deoxy-L-arabinose transferase-like glycosyltransferase
VAKQEHSPRFAAVRWIWLAPLLAAAVWLWAYQDLPAELWGGDEAEYADIARRIARGDGFTTGIIYPVELNEWGAERDHPSLLRPPLLPLLMAGAFALAGPEVWALHVLLLGIFVASATLAFALGERLAGPLAGGLAALAVISSPDTLALSLLAGTETLYGVWILSAFLLLARGARPLWIGGVCGLLYLTKYNGGILLPFALLYLALDRARWRAVPECAAGFALVALPWWIRNWLVTGNPLFTYNGWLIYFSPFARSYTTTLIHMLEPDRNAPTAIAPLEKARLLLPQLLMFWPPASANLVACVGLVVACVRRNRLSLCFAGLALATTVGLSFALPRGRYFAPLFPTLFTLGIVGWLGVRSHWKWLALTALLAAPLLPAFPPSAPDLAMLKQLILRSGKVEFPANPWARCLAEAEQPLVVSADASKVAWVSDVVTIWLPASERDFWRVVETYPVEFADIGGRKELLNARFAQHFEARPDCGPHLYQRRPAAGEPSGLPATAP